jgi:SNF family Na+-dependent transporter
MEHWLDGVRRHGAISDHSIIWHDMLLGIYYYTVKTWSSAYIVISLYVCNPNLNKETKKKKE